MGNRPAIKAMTLLAVLISFSNCVRQKVIFVPEASPENALIEKAWKDYRTAAYRRDAAGLKELTLETVHCYLCLENTEKEYERLDYIREHDPDWYDKLYQKMIYIPRGEFIENDLPLLFNERMKERLESRFTQYHQRDLDGALHYEILVTTTDPGEVALTHEGGQHAFLFKKTRTGYRLSEISTIP